jgi:hypothetical protein
VAEELERAVQTALKLREAVEQEPLEASRLIRTNRKKNEKLSHI